MSCDIPKFYSGGLVSMHSNPVVIIRSIAWIHAGNRDHGAGCMRGRTRRQTPILQRRPHRLRRPRKRPLLLPLSGAHSAFDLRSHRSSAWLPPATFDAGPFGKLSVNGIVTGYAQYRTTPFPATTPSRPRCQTAPSSSRKQTESTNGLSRPAFTLCRRWAPVRQRSEHDQ